MKISKGFKFIRLIIFMYLQDKKVFLQSIERQTSDLRILGDGKEKINKKKWMYFCEDYSGLTICP